MTDQPTRPAENDRLRRVGKATRTVAMLVIALAVAALAVTSIHDTWFDEDPDPAAQFAPITSALVGLDGMADALDSSPLVDALDSSPLVDALDPSPLVEALDQTAMLQALGSVENALLANAVMSCFGGLDDPSTAEAEIAFCAIETRRLWNMPWDHESDFVEALRDLFYDPSED